MAREIPDGFFSDTAIPNIFIMDHMRDLTAPALKVYLMVCYYQSQGYEAEAKLLRGPLDLSKEDFKAAVCELVGRELVDANPELTKLRPKDLKRQVVNTYYRPATNTPMTESVQRVSANKERNSLIKSINETFFHGLMGPTWYQTIDGWFHSYDFEPPVVYQMFADARQRNTLNGPNYLNKVAEDYHKNGVKSFADLSQYKEKTKQVHIIAQEVGKKLKKSMSSYDYAIVEKWVLEYAFDFGIIEVALRNAVRLSSPNLNYFDKILENWYKSGIKTAEEAENVEKNWVKQQELKSMHKIRAPKQFPIEQRDYGEEYYAQFYKFAWEEDLDDLLEQEESQEGNLDENKGDRADD